MNDAQFGLLISVGLALFAALIAHTTVCAERHVCVHDGTCTELNSGHWYDPSCSFRTTVTPAGFKLLNASVQYETMQRMNRGVCSPGLRQQVDSVTGDLTCVRKRSWPDAYLAEIGKPGASTDHERHCGKWIDAGSIAYGEQKWAFYDAKGVERDVDNLVRAKGASRMAATDLGKFRTSCRTMVVSNSQGASAKRAYDLLLPTLSVASLDKALESVGFLASHYCDTPALVGVGIEGATFTAKVLSGTVLSDQSIRNALYVIGADRQERNTAMAFAEAMRDLDATALQPTTLEHAAAVVHGTYRGTWLEGYVGPSLTITRAASNEPLERFVGAFASQGSVTAHAYLRGVAAVCSLAAKAVVVPEQGNLLPVLPERAQTGPSAPRTAAALGRLVDPNEDHDAVTEETVLNASTVRLSALAALSSASRSSARDVCLAAAKRIFPDDFDRITFNALVTPALYDRLEQLSNALRESTAVVLSQDAIGNIFAGHSDRSAAYTKVRAAKVRIAGAPRGTWAGIDREFRRPALQSDDGALTIIVKQARAVFLDRMLPVATSAGICEHPALYPGVSRNAYLLLTSSSACSMLLPGLLVPPFADERYDEASLASRVGFVMAHEFMHVTAYQSQWNSIYAKHLLGNYPDSTYIEAIADVGAAASLASLDYVSNETICASVSQLFCGRVGWMLVLDEVPPWHPPANIRGDNVCQFLRTHFAS
jgi:hypothetical protein